MYNISILKSAEHNLSYMNNFFLMKSSTILNYFKIWENRNKTVSVLEIGWGFLIILIHVLYKINDNFVSSISLDVYSLTLETDDVAILQEDNSIMLNCTFRSDRMETISNSGIRWQKQIGDEFKDLAAYSPPGGHESFIVEEMCPLFDNRTKLIAPNTTLSAVMIIKDPVCCDVGTYRCWIKYLYPGSLGKIKTSLSTFSFNGKDIYMLQTSLFIILVKINT